MRLDSNKGDDKGKGKGKDGGIGFLCAFCTIFHVSEALSDLVAGKKGKGKDDKGKGKGKKGVSLEWWLQMCYANYLAVNFVTFPCAVCLFSTIEHVEALPWNM